MHYTIRNGKLVKEGVIKEEKKFNQVKIGDTAITVDGDKGKVVDAGPALKMAKRYDKGMASDLDGWGLQPNDHTIVISQGKDKVVWGYGKDVGGAWVER